MRTLILCIGLITLLRQDAVHLQRKSNHIAITPMSFETHTMFAVTVDEAKEGQQAIVDVCYYTTPPGMTKLVFCKTSVVPVFGGVTVATEQVPVAVEDIHSVKVQIVRTVNYANFLFKKPDTANSGRESP